ncbi:FAD binding domain-containing protein [Tissierella sp. MB52-C2]|uniref:FAD binding domain-containing protein n=1 Tax=Tissierella sp. MB52-C2 TaxID=3070999 RepID=UPI00280C28DC|nr:FAD binding domain-containing protein [Tissierella sp. MB52-C2]WMM25349.1 FAD binding domain-containing protein [Tissierella sp. MB52-C2]
MTLKEVYNGRSVEEVVGLLGEYGNGAKLISGGTDIVIELKNKKITPKILIDISKIEELKEIREDENYITLGSGVTFTEIIENPLFSGNLHGLYKACRMVGSPQIRNKGTIGGNIANGSSAADGVPPLIALGATIKTLSIEGTREIPLEDYYIDKLKSNEIIIEVKFKKPNNNQILTFAKLGLRKALAISRLSIASLIGLNEEGIIESVTIASGALGKYPMREEEVEEYLINKKIDEKIIEEAITTLQNSMDERLKGRSTLPYKRVAVSSILRENLEELIKSRIEVEAW